MKWYEKAMGLGFRGLNTLLDQGAVERCIRQGPTDVLTIKNVDYAGHGDEAQMLDIVLPEAIGADENRPVVVYIHGGGWSYGKKELTSGFCNRIASHGYVVFNVNYRLAPENVHPAQLFDVLRAAEWVCQNGGDYHGDLNRVFLAGDSAGAHLASLVAAYITNPALRKRAGLRQLRIPADCLAGCLLFCGAYTPLRLPGQTRTLQMNTFVETEDPRPVSKPENLTAVGNLTADYPPCFLSSGEVDPLYRMKHTQRMMEALKDAGIPFEAHVYDKKSYPDAQHEFQLRDDSIACANECREALWMFMERISAQKG